VAVIGPTLLTGNALGRWKEVRLDRPRRVEAVWVGKVPQLTLVVEDQLGGRVQLGSRLFWQRAGWQQVYGYVLEAVLAAPEPHRIADAKTIKRLRRAAWLPDGRAG